MFGRPLHPQPIPLPPGYGENGFISPVKNAAFTPGQAAAIRFFDPNSLDDLFAMQDILRGEGARRWMDDVKTLSLAGYKDWAGTEGPSSFLFAVHDARATTEEELGKVRGFVYAYSEREEKLRAKRMERLGFLQPLVGRRLPLEVSFAVRPLASGQQFGSGLMSSALRQSCLQIGRLLEGEKFSDIVISAFVDPQNAPSIRTLEASGFTNRGLMKYDWDSDDADVLYILDWQRLHEKVHARMMEILASDT